ncbi:MAG: C10 family peptidase [Bacteroidaceae bacterium]|nr:C10 family peptidase [Bacteroidaceae bacterium]
MAHSLRYDAQHISPDMPPALQELLRAYRTQPRYAQPLPGKAVAPLLQSVRHQEEPFNCFAPFYTYDDGRVSDARCVSGCVATCIEQVLTYWRFPDELADTLYGWQTAHYVIDDVLPGSRIDWDNILPRYDGDYTEEQGRAVGWLTYLCGVAALMNWRPGSSGANLWRAAEPLCRAFGYQTVVFAQRCLFSPQAWNRILRNELEQGRPICYTGHNMALSGHAFNIDGVDEDGYYHLNWGYGGAYDGYYDLDYLNPFEALGNVTELGQQEGFFSNQTALFLAPGDCDIDLSDTLAEQTCLHSVAVEEVRFRRSPDTQAYTVVDFTLRSTADAPIDYTFEALTYTAADTALFEQCDYVAIHTVRLQPGERTTIPVYCQFTEPGERIFAISTDDETTEWSAPITVAEGTPAQLTFSPIGHQLVRYGDDLTATFSLTIGNEAASGTAGNLVTYCLFEDGSPDDQRHWEVLCLPAGEQQRFTTTFHHLTEGRRYELLVRCPWAVQQSLTFVAEHAADGVARLRPAEPAPAFDLLGRAVRPRQRGLCVSGGRKWLR